MQILSFGFTDETVLVWTEQSRAEQKRVICCCISISLFHCHSHFFANSISELLAYSGRNAQKTDKIKVSIAMHASLSSGNCREQNWIELVKWMFFCSEISFFTRACMCAFNEEIHTREIHYFISRAFPISTLVNWINLIFRWDCFLISAHTESTEEYITCHYFQWNIMNFV